MSTDIITIPGTYHKHVTKSYPHVITRDKAEVVVNRFWAGKELGRNVQLTINQRNGDISYIHLTQEQCNELGKALMECFDDEKYPSE